LFGESWGEVDDKQRGEKGYWKKVKVFSAFFGWTLPSQYGFSNLDRRFLLSFGRVF
jgi:hypothetical protein